MVKVAESGAYQKRSMVAITMAGTKEFGLKRLRKFLPHKTDN